MRKRGARWSRRSPLLLVLLGLVAPGCGRDYDPGAGAALLEPEIAAYRMRTEPAPERIERRMRELNVPGASVAAVAGYSIDWARGFGVRDADTREPVTPRTLFQAASISKCLAAVAAMKLVETGRLRLDADINASLEGWRIPPNGLTAKTPVTLRHLLSHTGGLTVSGFRGYAQGEPVPTVEQILDGAGPANNDPVRVVVEPGTEWSYSGGGYTVVQVAIAEAGGDDYAELLRGEILEPLGMDDSTFDQPLAADALPLAATGHARDGRPIPGKRHTYPELAAAGLWTTPSDLARFLIDLQLALEGRAGTILTPESTSAVLTEVRDGYGLGFIVNGEPGEPTWGHTGGNAGFAAYMLASRRGGNGVVVMTNGDNGGPLFREIVQAVRNVYGW